MVEWPDDDRIEMFPQMKGTYWTLVFFNVLIVFNLKVKMKSK